MLKNILNSITNNSAKSFPTYQLSLLQSKTHRIIKQVTTQALKKYKLSYVDWSLLGLLFEKKELRYGSLADELGVEPSFVSVLIEGLQKKGYIREKKHTSDKRIKFIYLTKKGLDLVPQVEEHLKMKLQNILNGLPAQDMNKYLVLMATFIKNVSMDIPDKPTT